MIREFKMEVRVNQNPKVLFWRKKGESVTADYAGKASADGYNIALVGIRETGPSGNEYVRLSFTLSKGDTKVWWNGRLFDNTRRVEGSRQPNYTGDVQLDRNDQTQRLRLAAWVRFDDPKDEGTAYLSLDVSEFREKAPAATAGVHSSAVSSTSDVPL